jgi:hypothetical protein
VPGGGLKLTRGGRAVVAGAGLVAAMAFVGGLLVGAPGGSGKPASAAVQATPAPTPRPLGKPVRIVWGGDVTLGSSRGLPPDAGRPQLAAVASVLRAADVAAVNYEGTFGAGGGPNKCTGSTGTNCFAFQAPPANAATLRHDGVDIVNQANNHAFDFGPLGWHATRLALQHAKVLATGAPGEIQRLRRNGTRIAVLGFSTYRWSNSMSDPAAVTALVGLAARESDVVVVFIHAGAEGADQAHVPAGAETAFGEDRGNSRAFAREAIDAGADLVLGSGPHILRGMELYKGRLVAYSLGNLAGWKNFAVHGQLALSALLGVTVAPDGRFERGQLTSLLLNGDGVPRRDPAGSAAQLVASLTRTDFPGGGLRISRRGAIRPRRAAG